MRGRFVGRESELGVIAGSIAGSIGRSGPTATLVLGGPGAGKSRLLREAIASTHGRCLLHAVGYEPSRSVPLTAVQQVLRDLTRAPRGGRRLRQAAYGESGRAAQATALRVFEAAYRCLTELAPAVLLVDDVQWVDETSTAFIGYLLRAAEADAMPIAAVAAGRPGSMTGAFVDMLRSALEHGSVIDVNLSPLPEQEGVAMVRSIAPKASLSEAERIWRMAAGSSHGGIENG